MLGIFKPPQALVRCEVHIITSEDLTKVKTGQGSFDVVVHLSRDVTYKIFPPEETQHIDSLTLKFKRL